MGFLRDVGRSGAVGQLGQGFLSGAIQAGQFMQQSETNALQRQKEELEINALKEKQKILHQPQNIRDSVLTLSLPEDKREEFVNMYIKGGYADPDGTTSMFKRNLFLGEHEEGIDFYFKSLKEGASMDVDKTFKALQSAQMSGDQEKIDKAMQAFKYASSKAAAVGGAYKDAMNMLKGDSDLKVGDTFADPSGRQVNFVDGRYVYADNNTPVPKDTLPLIKKIGGGEKEPTSPVGMAFELWKQQNPNASPQEQQKELERLMSIPATVRSETFRVTGSGIPGVMIDRLDKKLFIVGQDGTRRDISSAEALQIKLRTGEATVTSDIKSMQQSAPHVLDLARKSLREIHKQMSTLGPMMSRWRDFWQQGVGVKDVPFSRLYANIKLMKTRLMRMHVGARGGVEMLKHFDALVEEGKQAPENMVAALEEIIDYSNETMKSQVKDIPLPGEGSISGEGTDINSMTDAELLEALER